MTLKENAPDIVHPVTREQATMLTEILPISPPLKRVSTGLAGFGCAGRPAASADSIRAGFAPMRRARQRLALPGRVTWDASTLTDLPRFDGPAALEDENVRVAWIEALHVYGAADPRRPADGR